MQRLCHMAFTIVAAPCDAFLAEQLDGHDLAFSQHCGPADRVPCASLGKCSAIEFDLLFVLAFILSSDLREAKCGPMSHQRERRYIIASRTET